LIKVQFHVEQHEGSLPNSFHAAPFELELPKRLTVYAVLGIVGKKTGISPFQIQLFWETGEWEFKKAGHVDNDEEWDSEDEDDEAAGTQGKVLREVHIVPGTRSLGTWVEGSQVTIRVDVESDDQIKHRMLSRPPLDLSVLGPL
jgi:hypothetical protein